MINTVVCILSFFKQILKVFLLKLKLIIFEKHV